MMCALPLVHIGGDERFLAQTNLTPLSSSVRPWVKVKSDFWSYAWAKGKYFQPGHLFWDACASGLALDAGPRARKGPGGARSPLKL